MRELGLPEMIVICGVLVLFAFALVLLIGALRWKQGRSMQRTLIDKLALGNELAAFLQSPAGDRFMRGISDSESPARSIITSIQRGIVVFVVGLGTLFLRGSLPMAVRFIGFLLISLGAGLLIAAFVSYLLARRWQLLEKDADPSVK
jgi:hypothetical protein